MRPTPKQREAFAQAFYKHAQNKIPACKRLEVRGQSEALANYRETGARISSDRDSRVICITGSDIDADAGIATDL